MNYMVRVIVPEFMIGTTVHEIGSEIEVNEMAKEYLVNAGSVEVVNEVPYATDQAGYNRRDMQAESAPMPVVKTKRKRRTKAEMEAAQAA